MVNLSCHSRDALRARAVQDDFCVADVVPVSHAHLFDKIAGDVGVFEAFDFAAVFADEVGVLVFGDVVGITDRVHPASVFAADAVDEAFFDEGVEGAVGGDAVDAFHFREHLRDGQRASRLGEDVDHAEPHGGAAQA